MITLKTNLGAMLIQQNLKTSTNKLNVAIERMTTGFKVNHARDNAANFGIITDMSSKITSFDIADENTAMGLDLLVTASETLSLIQDRVQRLRDLQEQASNGTYGEQSLQAINQECNALVDEINRLYLSCEYNGINLFLETTTNADGEAEILQEVYADSSTTFEELGITSSSFSVYDKNNTVVATYDIEGENSIDDLFATLEGHGFSANIVSGEIKVKSPDGSYIAGALADELGIMTEQKSYVASTSQTSSAPITFESVSSSTTEEVVYTTTTTSETQTNTIYITTTTESTVTETITITTTTETTETETITITTTTSTTQTIVSTATVEASTTAKFIQDITRIDTSGMTALSSVNKNADLADGTYKISTTAELSILASMTNAGYVSEGDTFVLANDIDMSSCTTWTPIGNSFPTVGESFTGCFNGNGYTISNLTVTMSSSYGGLFGCVEGSVEEQTVITNSYTTTNLEGETVDTVYRMYAAYRIPEYQTEQNRSFQ